MTKVEIHPGICGFLVTVTAEEIGPKKVHLNIETDCKEVKELASQIETLSVEDTFSFPFGEDKVYQAAKRAIRHASCPVPCGIIKAAEAELGLAVKQDVLIHFKHE